jgi:glutathione S-transferase
LITVYHLRNSRSERILWLLEELGLGYSIETFERDPTFRAPEAMRKIHELGKSPIVRDGEVLLAESGAIVDYLVTRHGKGRLAPPHADPAWARYVFWLHFAEGSLMPWLTMDLLLTSGMVPGVDPGPLGPMIKQELARYLHWMDGDMTGHEFAAGDAFSAADVMLAYALEFANSRGHLADTRNLASYLERMTARDAYRRAKQKAAE